MSFRSRQIDVDENDAVAQEVSLFRSRNLSIEFFETKRKFFTFFRPFEIPVE
ncbi:hypothetical protein LEP1GSC168_0271 [Leptospira santarosai str. HAI134]|uniref:Uncharacterized protein n=1 Tax=Leptospira santarosai serovar Shermani str. LT 821 TaxID=758847 RepID=K8YCD8_9LEPT|nr:hypothetical protein LSS_08964 [Leptospira santarosai serovar Shermani str. LT 821]EMO21057.1 hypothetical protein LEP1GSC168_0271 [Leptospira santarosai str. HAI134]